jgi:hypothetical protein
MQRLWIKLGGEGDNASVRENDSRSALESFCQSRERVSASKMVVCVAS